MANPSAPDPSKKTEAPACDERGALGPLLIDVGADELDGDDVRRISHPLVGGVILSARNYKDKGQLRRLCESVKVIKRPSALIFVEQEGRRLQNFRPGFCALPSPWVYEVLAKRTGMKTAEDAAAATGRIMAWELMCCGEDMSFSPTADVRRSGRIGDNFCSERSFGSSPQTASRFVLAYGKGMRHAGMARCARYFPGEGSVRSFSPGKPPRSDASRGVLRAIDRPAFKALIDAGVESILMSDAIFTAVDPDNPARYSAKWIKEILRGELGFKGLTISSDLGLIGKTEDKTTLAERCVRALGAGCEALVVRNDKAQLDAALSDPRLAEAVERCAPDVGDKLAALAARQQRWASMRPQGVDSEIVRLLCAIDSERVKAMSHLSAARR